MISLNILFLLLSYTSSTIINLQDSIDNNKNTAKSDDYSYFLMIDAGSSGSRLHIYRYIPKYPVPIFDIKSTTLKETPGLSTFADNPEGCRESIKKLLVFAQQNVPASKRSSTPLHLFATAGIRSLVVEVAEEILEVVRDEIHKSVFLFDSSWAHIVNGKDEGIFNWISTNFLLDNLYPDSSKMAKTCGVIEMGGASLQLSFLTDTTDSLIVDKHCRQFSLFGKHYTLYTNSYFRYGLQAAQQLFIEKSQTKTENNPCFLQYDPIMNQTTRGSYTNCTSLIKSVLFEDSSECQVSYCSLINSVPQPSIGETSFIAIENLFYTSEFYGIKLNDNIETWKNVEQGAKNFCYLNYNLALSEYPNESPSDISKYCFSGAYINTIYKMLRLDPAKIKPTKLIRGSEVDWTLGAVLLEITTHTHNIGPPDNLIPRPKSQTWWLDNSSVLLFLLLLPILFYYIVYKYRNDTSFFKSFFRGHYSRIATPSIDIDETV